MLGLCQPLVRPNYKSGLENMRDNDGFYSSRPYFLPESIECFIEGQAFPPAYDLAPRPPLPFSSSRPYFPESIECFIEGQAFPPPYDLAPRPPTPLPHVPSVSSSGDTQEEGEGLKGVGEEQNHTTVRKPGLL